MNKYQVKGKFVAEVRASDPRDAVETLMAGLERISGITLDDGTFIDYIDPDLAEYSNSMEGDFGVKLMAEPKKNAN